jgi:hypothetical protein
MNGPMGDEVVRKRVEELANRMRPASVLVCEFFPVGLKNI